MQSIDLSGCLTRALLGIIIAIGINVPTTETETSERRPLCPHERRPWSISLR